jgi:acyl-CoA reductase-like NAD-dependent aldehyde dehydrogenase
MIACANDVPYGLSAYVWTRDVALGHRVARRLHSGSVFINTAGAGDPCFPCGGFKQSGWGRERGREGFDAYLQTKSIGCAI